MIIADTATILDYITALGTLGAVLIAVVAVCYTNKNNRQQIRTGKLEELYEGVQLLSSYYPDFEILHYQISVFRSEEKKAFEWLPKYYEIRDNILPESDRNLIITNLGRIEVLGQCYTNDLLQQDILHFLNLLYWFSDKVFDGSSMNDILVDKVVFPSHSDFMKLVEGIKSKILKEINP